MAEWLEDVFQVSERRVSNVVPIARTTKRYKLADKGDEPFRIAIREIAQSRPRFGYRRILTLLRRQGYEIGRDRVYRIYREEGLQVRTKRRKKTVSRRRGLLPRARGLNKIWSMDFVHDELANQRKIRMLTIVDHFSRESVAIEVDHGLRAPDVIRCLSRLKITRGLPKIISVDNGSEFSGKELDRFAYENGLHLHFIRPGKPTENAYIESFNGRHRDECLNANTFYSIEDAKDIIERWREDYNNWRPHSSLGDLSPMEYIKLTGNRKNFEMTHAS